MSTRYDDDLRACRAAYRDAAVFGATRAVPVATTCAHPGCAEPAQVRLLSPSLGAACAHVYCPTHARAVFARLAADGVPVAQFPLAGTRAWQRARVAFVRGTDPTI